MQTAATIQRMVVGLALMGGVVTSCAQGGYGPPQTNYPPDNGQSGRYDPPQNGGYGQQPYDNQPGYGQPDFYADLAPHGQWVNTREYGRVWIPNAGPDFQPYATNGHWVVTEYGNTWVSDYAWGWAPFHYGRWYQDRFRGWAWVPGADWGPAWVSWRSGGGYYGWAPLGPGGNMNINNPWNQYVFVPQAYITSPRLYSYCVPRPQVVNIYQNTTVINNVYRSGNRAYAYGPRRDEIERVTRQRVPVYQIENTRRPGRDEVRGNSVGIYRPETNRSTGSRNGTESRVYEAPFDNSGRGNSGRGSSRGSGRYSPPATNVPATPGAGSGSGRTGTERPFGDGTNPDPRVYQGNGSSTYPSGRGSSRGQGRPNYEATPQPVQPAPPVSQPGRQEPVPQGQRETGGSRRGGGGSYSRPEVSQPQPQPSSGYGGGRQAQPQQQAQPQVQPQPQQPQQQQPQAQPQQPQAGSGTYQSGRGSSRGPR